MQGNTQQVVPTEFGFEYLKYWIERLTVRVINFRKDFFEHELYKIEFLNGGEVVHYCQRRYNDFQAFNEMILLKFSNIQLDHFPSKWKIFHKISSRMEHFHKMMIKLMKFAKDHIEARNKMLSCIASFVKQTLPKDSKDEKQGGPRRPSQTLAASALQPSTKMQETMTKSLLTLTPKDSRISMLSIKKKESVYQYYYVRYEGEYEWKKRYLKINNSCLQIYKDVSKNTWENMIELYRIKVEYLRKDPDLLDHFMQKMEFQIEMPKYPQNYAYISLFHEYDCKKFLITCSGAHEDAQSPEDALKSLTEKLAVGSMYSSLREDYDGYFSAVGKIYFALHDLIITSALTDSDRKSLWLVRVKTSAFSYDTKQVPVSNGRIKQGIIIPISNVFEQFTLQLVKVVIQGLISEEIKHKVIASTTLLMSDMLSYNNDYKFERSQVKLFGQDSRQFANLSLSIRNMSDNSSIYSDSFANGSDGMIMDYEKMSSREILNAFDETIDRLLYVIGSICLFVQSTWRNIYFFKYPRLAGTVFAILGVSFIYADMNNIVAFLILMLALAIIYNHRAIHGIVNQISDWLFTGKDLRHSDFKQPMCLSKAEIKYLKWNGNLIRISQEQIRQSVSQDVKQKTKFFLLKKGDTQYKIEQEKQSLYQKFTEVKNTIQEMHGIINRTVFLIEKIAGIYSWVDFRRTLYFLIFVIVLLLLTNAVALRFIGFFFCLHRFKKGFQFYKKHYARNRKLAHDVLSYVIGRNFRDLYNQVSTEKKVCVQDLYFPIEEQPLKKLKKSIETLLPVGISISQILEVEIQGHTDDYTKQSVRNQKEQFIKKYIKNKKICIAYFVDLIESCESRLKLEKLTASEGRSESYQKLREETKEDPAIDVWLEDLILNYILNTPSQLYNLMHDKIHRENNLFGKDVQEWPSTKEDKELFDKFLDGIDRIATARALGISTPIQSKKQ